MKLIAAFLFVFLSLCFYQCVHHDQKNVKSVKLFMSDQVKKIKLDEETSNISQGIQYFLSDSSFLYLINWNNNSLYVYDFESANLLKQLKLEEEGEKGVGGIMGVHIQNKDSLFLFPFSGSQIFLINQNYDSVQKFNYDIPDMQSSAMVHNSFFVSPPVLKKGKILVKSRPLGNYRTMTQEELNERKMTYEIDLTDSKETKMVHSFPSDYLANGLKSFEFSMAYDGSKYVFSIFGDHRLFIAEGTNDSLISVNAASRYFPEVLPLFPLNGDRFASMNYQFNSHSYTNIIYDPFREVYYRFAHHPKENITEEELLELRIAPEQFSILTLSKELNVLDEILLPKNTFVPANFFVNEDGLYISRNHPQNVENNEDELVFQLLKLAAH